MKITLYVPQLQSARNLCADGIHVACALVDGNSRSFCLHEKELLFVTLDLVCPQKQNVFLNEANLAPDVCSGRNVIVPLIHVQDISAQGEITQLDPHFIPTVW